jgi:hypothetical protein
VCWGYKGRICVPNVMELKDKYFVKHMSLLIPFISKGIRCTMISRPLIGSTVRKGPLLSMLPFATLVSESKPSINDLLDYCSRCKCPSGSRKGLPWILSWVCQQLSQAMILFG